MNRRLSTASISSRAFQILAGVILLGMLPDATAAGSIVEAYAEVNNCGQVIDRGPTSALASNVGGPINTGVCALPGPTASAEASFSTGTISLSMTSIPQRGVDGTAYLNDHLTFQVPGGGYAQVDVIMAGDWGGTYDLRGDFQVEFNLGLGPTLYQGRAYSNFYDNGVPASRAFTGTDVGGGVVLGSYLFRTTWTVRDGVDYEFFAGLKAQASNGGTGYIDDPLIIMLPAGVTYTSGSGRIYAAVPEPPSALLLLGAGLAGVAWRRFHSRA